MHAQRNAQLKLRQAIRLGTPLELDAFRKGNVVDDEYGLARERAHERLRHADRLDAQAARDELAEFRRVQLELEEKRPREYVRRLSVRLGRWVGLVVAAVHHQPPLLGLVSRFLILLGGIERGSGWRKLHVGKTNYS